MMGLKMYQCYMSKIRNLLSENDGSLTLGKILDYLEIAEKDERSLLLTRTALQQLQKEKVIEFLNPDVINAGINYTLNPLGGGVLDDILRDLKVFLISETTAQEIEDIKEFAAQIPI